MGRSRARAVLVVAALAIPVVTAGCGGGGDDGGRDSTIGGARVSWGEPEGGHPTAVVMLIHGGGWHRSNSGYEEQKANAQVLLARGYATVAIGYDTGVRGFRQVIDVYDAARERYPGLPICATGISAGANLALMLATREPDLDCVVAVSAPTDLTTIAQQDPQGHEAYEAAVETLGTDQLTKFSPVRDVDRIRAKVLLIAAQTDPIVPSEQGRELARALPGAQLLLLPPGPVRAEWAHFGGVQPDSQGIALAREFAFLREATQQGSVS
jgi:acetyl esterase/lipase